MFAGLLWCVLSVEQSVTGIAEKIHFFQQKTVNVADFSMWTEWTEVDKAEFVRAVMRAPVKILPSYS